MTLCAHLWYCENGGWSDSRGNLAGAWFQCVLCRALQWVSAFPRHPLDKPSDRVFTTYEPEFDDGRYGTVIRIG
jgi:hypothetical protein